MCIRDRSYIKVGVKVTKSLVSPPNSEVYGHIFRGIGFDRRFELLKAMVDSGLMDKAGAYFKDSYGNTLGPGYVQAAVQLGNDFNAYRRTYEDYCNSQ